MTRPQNIELVPGSFSRPNTRKTEIVLRWVAERGGRTFYLREHLDYDDSAFDERLCGYLPLGELPAPPTIEGLDDYRRALEARFDVHPLANQLPSVLDLVVHVLEHADPLDIVRVSARYLCVAGVARGFGRALVGVAGGPFRSDVEPIELRRLARACGVLELGTLDCHGSYGPWESRARSLLDELPPYPSGKHPSHDGGQHDEVCLEYDRLLSEYLRAAAEQVERALALPAEKLDARSGDVRLPTGVWSVEEASSKVHDALAKASWLWQLDLSAALTELHGQPLASIAPLLSKLFSGVSPVPLPSEVRLTPEGLAEGSMVVKLLDVVAASDLDLGDAIRAQAETRAAEAAEREAAQKRIEEQYRAGPTPRFRNLPRVPPYWLALGALLLAALALGVCSRSAIRGGVAACGESSAAMTERTQRILAAVEAKYGPPSSLRDGRVRIHDGSSTADHTLPRFELSVDDFGADACAWTLRAAAHVVDAGDDAEALVSALDAPEVRRAFERRGFFEARADGSVWLVQVESLRVLTPPDLSWLDDHLDLAGEWSREWIGEVRAHLREDAGLPRTTKYRPGHDPESVLEGVEAFLRDAGVRD